jgi:hypothetical protein
MLHGLREKLGVVQPVVRPVEREPLLRPESVDDGNRFLESGPALVHVEEREAELRVLLLPPACAHPDLNPATADLVDRRRRLREERGRTEGDR